MTTIGFIGAGHIGQALAKAFIGLGYDVVISNSRGPETLDGVVAELGPNARAATASEAADAAHVAVVTIPFHAEHDVPVQPFTGKIVLDTDNYFPPGGPVDALDRGEATVSGLLQAHLPTSKVVKVFSSIPSVEILTDGLPAGSPNRRALPMSSDYPEAIAFVRDLLDKLGYDAVDVSPLSESWRFEFGRPAFVVRQNKVELEANLAKAQRVL